MKKQFFTIFSLIITINLFAQYDVDINKNKTITAKERRTNDQLKREEMGGCKFIPFHEYQIGMKFYFPKDEFKLEYASYFPTDYYKITQIKKNKFQQSKISYKDLAGKIFEIEKIEERKQSIFEDTFITLKQVDSAFTIEHKMQIPRESLKKSWEDKNESGQTFVLPSAIYTGEIDTFKEKYLNKEFYSNFLVKGKRYKKVKIIEVGAGKEHEPIRAVVENENGDKEQVDFCTCGTNVPSLYLYSNTMNNYFLKENPKDKFKGKDETWESICQKKIQIGFTEEELRLSWGIPEKINETIVSGRQHQQYVYKDQYVYVENGIVTSFQNLK